MTKLFQKEQKIIAIILEKGALSSSAVHLAMVKSGEEISLVTIKRTLAEMTGKGVLVSMGLGRATSYDISVAGRVSAKVDAKKYCSFEPDKRHGLTRYNFDLFAALPKDIFTEEELNVLNDATAEYKKRIKNLPPAIQKKELERLIIELSWKSSKIEGNTYTLLDTEKLIL